MGLTTREVDAGEFRPAKQRRLNAKRALLWIRRRIARVINDGLERLGHAVRVTHRSLAAEYRKLNRQRAGRGLLPLETPETTRHRGPRATHRLRREEPCRIEVENERIHARNQVVLAFNARARALDEPLAVVREEAEAAAPIAVRREPAGQPITGDRLGIPGVISPTAAGEMNEKNSVDCPSPAPEAECDPTAGTIRSVHPLPSEEAGSSPGQESTGTEDQASTRQEIFELQSTLAMDEHYRKEWDRQWERVEALIPKCLEGQVVADARRWAASPVLWKRFVARMRELAAEEPDFRLRATMLLSSSLRRAWEERGRDLVELVQVLERAWAARLQILGDEERAAVLEKVQKAGRRLADLNAGAALRDRLNPPERTSPGRPLGYLPGL